MAYCRVEPRLQHALTPRHTPERHFAPIYADCEFISISDTASCESDDDCPWGSELGAAAPYLRGSSLKLAKGGEKALVKPRLLLQGKSEKDRCACEFRIAALMLESLLSSSRLSPDLGNYVSPSGKPNSNESTRARSGSYSLSADAVSSAHNLQRLSEYRAEKKRARAEKKPRGGKTC